MKSLSARVSRFGRVALGCLALGLLCGCVIAPAIGAESKKEETKSKITAPDAARGKVISLSDTTARVRFEATPKDDKTLEVVVFYGKEDGAKAEGDWDSNTGLVRQVRGSEEGIYKAKFTDLKPDTTYFYRVRAANAAGTAWSESVEFHTEKAGTPWYMQMLILLIILAIFIIPAVVGNWLARLWRMPDYGWKLGIILFSLVFGIVIVATRPISLGIDLSGGVVLVYEVDEEQQKAKDEARREAEGEAKKGETDKKGALLDDQEMNQLVGALELRINPSGQRDVPILKYGPNQIQITIPRANADEVARIKQRIVKSGTLEFRILADQRNRNHKDAITQALRTKDNTVWSEDEEEILGWWTPVRPGEEDDFIRDKGNTVRTANYAGKEVLQVLVVNDEYDVTGKYLRSCRPGVGNDGSPAVHFSFDSEGADRFGDLTYHNRPDETQKFYRKLGIILDGYLYSAPIIKTTIRAQGEISGRFTQKEVKELVDVLNAGSLPTALKKNPISEMNIGPTLGQDTIERGAYAIGLSLLVVLAFMIVYYRFAGLVACGALFMTMLLLVAIMIAVKADFTLPGIAGLVLTVGMAVDANVLIFERIREETDRGAALRMAIRNGFGRALSAIVDANLTTLITAIILYVIGTPQLKGFAVVIILGVLLSMFTAIFCSRVVFDISERRGWIKKLTMMRAIGHTNINFIGMRYAAVSISLALIVIGIVAVGFRGKGLLDIDFTGGESIQILLKESKDIGDVRKILEKQKDAEGKPLFPDLAVYDVKLKTEKEGVRFLINTSFNAEGQERSAIEVVEAELQRVFKENKDQLGSLAVNGLTIGKVTHLGGSSADKPEAPKEPAKDQSEAKKPKPAETDQSRNDLPSPSLLVSADPAAVLLAQAEPTIEAADPADEAKSPKAEPKTEKPAEPKNEAKAPKAEEPPVESPNAETAPPVEAEPSNEKPAEVALQPRSRFDGGIRVELQFLHPIDHDTAKEHITARLAAAKLGTVPFDLDNEEYEPGGTKAYTNWVLRIKMPEDEVQEKVLGPIQEQMNSTPFFPSSSSIGGKVAGNMQETAILALLGSLIAIIGYLWIRFQKVMYGLAAVVALVHDVLITLGALAVSAYLAPVLDTFKISLSVLAAFLTIIGYSLNDTIVVFDRIREVKGKTPQLNAGIINSSINQTLSRTLLTSLTTLMVIVVLFFGGGSGLHAFAFTLMVGVIIGTYSSIFVASPILFWMSKPAVERNTAKK